MEPYYAAGSLENAEVTILLAVWQAMMVIPLLVVCLNVSGMVQVRSAMRERELTIRQALGASRKRLMQHLLAEAVVLAGSRRNARVDRALQPSAVGVVVDRRTPAGATAGRRSESTSPHDRGLCRTLSGDEPGVWMAARTPFQPSRRS